MTKEIGCTECPYAGHIELKECPDAYTEISQHCGLYKHEPINSKKADNETRRRQTMKLEDGITIKCPYNDFKDCFEFHCPFYYKQWQIVDHATGRRGYISHCKRAEKEIEKRGR